MKLIKPNIRYQQSYLEAVEEAKGETGNTVLKKPKAGESFKDFVNQILNEAKGINLPEGIVPATILWLVDNDEFIGRVSIRHKLNDNLRKIGGHIGYYIRASKRKIGYGKAILKLALPEAKKLGLTKVLVTCDEDNIGSQKIIEENHGVLENIVEMGPNLPRKRRFWITF